MSNKNIRNIVIIPRRDVLDIPIYKSGSDFLKHDEMYKEFTKKHFGEYLNKFDLLDQGFIIFEAYDDVLGAWIPEEITKEQYDVMLTLKSFIECFNIFDVVILDGIDPKYVFDKNMFDAITIDDFSILESDIKKKSEYFYQVIKNKCIKNRGRL